MNSEDKNRLFSITLIKKIDDPYSFKAYSLATSPAYKIKSNEPTFFWGKELL